jgi:glucose-1-phosphate adenylyltransferase
MAHTILVTGQKYLLSIIKSAIKSKQSSPNIFEMIINTMINNGIKNESINAFYWPMKTVPDYYNINMEILKNYNISSLIYHKSPIKSFITEKGQAVIGVNAKIANSIISDNCRIYGTVMNSIIFPGVEIGENTHVKDSIILPNAIIGSGSYITKTIIDERTDIKIENDTTDSAVKFPNIGNKCYIGTSDGQMKNNEFSSLNGSLTLIGKNCRIPNEAKVGGACYIASGKGESYFQKNKHLYNGLSILN